jgi:hypothetical protein
MMTTGVEVTHAQDLAVQVAARHGQFPRGDVYQIPVARRTEVEVVNVVTAENDGIIALTAAHARLHHHGTIDNSDRLHDRGNPI